MFIKEKSREFMDWAKIKIWISQGNKKKKLEMREKSRKIMGLSQSKDWISIANQQKKDGCELK